MKKSEKLYFILTRGFLIGMFLFLFFHMYRILIVTELSVSEYFSEMKTKELLLEGIAMLVSGFILGFYVRRQMDNLKKAKGEE
ncbi:MAG: hypothetical protein PF448_06555 [Bacteroidales bacterium]|jgi:ABC-type antimicrobial peptide transport system permease subunit|nr:hypothetical protein [Bacteroidales bacterium]